MIYNVNFALSISLLLVAFSVLILVINAFIEKTKKRQFDEVWELLLAIIFEYVSLGYIRIMYITGHYAMIDHKQAEQNGWSIPLFLLGLNISGLVFCKVAFGKGHKAMWKMLCILTFSCFIFSYLLATFT